MVYLDSSVRDTVGAPYYDNEDPKDKLDQDASVGESGSYLSALEELISTEKEYLTDLCVLQQLYVHHLYKVAKSDEGFVTSEDVHLLFSNVNEIVAFSAQLLAKLRTEFRKPLTVQQFGKIFLNCIEHFSIYTLYCANQHKQKETVERLMLNKEFVKFLQERQKNELQLGLSLKSFLIKPVQR